MLGVLEIPLNETGVRETPIVQLQGAKSEALDGLFLDFAIALSPDGTTLAGTLTYLCKDEPDACGLYLLDLVSPDRKVTKVPLPAPMTATPSEEAEEGR